MQKKIQKMFFDFEKLHLDCFRYTFAFTETEYLSSGANMLRNSLKMLDTTKMKFC